MDQNLVHDILEQLKNFSHVPAEFQNGRGSAAPTPAASISQPPRSSINTAAQVDTGVDTTPRSKISSNGAQGPQSSLADGVHRPADFLKNAPLPQERPQSAFDGGVPLDNVTQAKTSGPTPSPATQLPDGVRGVVPPPQSSILPDPVTNYLERFASAYQPSPNQGAAGTFAGGFSNAIKTRMTRDQKKREQAAASKQQDHENRLAMMEEKRKSGRAENQNARDRAYSRSLSDNNLSTKDVIAIENQVQAYRDSLLGDGFSYSDLPPDQRAQYDQRVEEYELQLTKRIATLRNDWGWKGDGTPDVPFDGLNSRDEVQMLPQGAFFKWGDKTLQRK